EDDSDGIIALELFLAGDGTDDLPSKGVKGLVPSILLDDPVPEFLQNCSAPGVGHLDLAIRWRGDRPGSKGEQVDSHSDRGHSKSTSQEHEQPEGPARWCRALTGQLQSIWIPMEEESGRGQARRFRRHVRSLVCINPLFPWSTWERPHRRPASRL